MYSEVIMMCYFPSEILVVRVNIQSEEVMLCYNSARGMEANLRAKGHQAIASIHP